MPSKVPIVDEDQLAADIGEVNRVTAAYRTRGGPVDQNDPDFSLLRDVVQIAAKKWREERLARARDATRAELVVRLPRIYADVADGHITQMQQEQAIRSMLESLGIPKSLAELDE